MEDFIKKYIDICIRNWQLKSEVKRLHKDLCTFQDMANVLYKYRRGIALVCPLAAGYYNDFINATFVYDWRYTR